MTNAAVTASSRAREIFKRVSRGTHPRSRLRPSSKKISNVLRPVFLVRANARRSRVRRRVRHDAQRVVCPANSMGSLCFRVFAYNSADDYRAVGSFVFARPAARCRVFVDFFFVVLFLPANIIVMMRVLWRPCLSEHTEREKRSPGG